MEEILKNIAEYGIQTVIIIVLGYYILKKENDAKEARREEAERHEKERAEWLLHIDKQWESIERLQTTTHQILRENTSVISELKGLLKNSN